MSKAKREARKKRKQRKKGRSEFGKALNSVRPKSEVWFESKMKEFDLRFPFEKNITFGGYIPDFINKNYKVIVEVDGSIHEKEEVKRKDEIKEKRYKSLGYTVVRIKAYDEESLISGIETLRKIRLSKPAV